MEVTTEDIKQSLDKSMIISGLGEDIDDEWCEESKTEQCRDDTAPLFFKIKEKGQTRSNTNEGTIKQIIEIVFKNTIRITSKAFMSPFDFTAQMEVDMPRILASMNSNVGMVRIGRVFVDVQLVVMPKPKQSIQLFRDTLSKLGLGENIARSRQYRQS